ncbi:hypothetical protein VCHA37P199_110080 [Vibrio chagasii]|nr:hypothetical protein VCHA37P199_110080 [Vibrio chagasii]
MLLRDSIQSSITLLFHPTARAPSPSLNGRGNAPDFCIRHRVEALTPSICLNSAGLIIRFISQILSLSLNVARDMLLSVTRVHITKMGQKWLIRATHMTENCARHSTK